jgi:hypothetical protein
LTAKRFLGQQIGGSDGTRTRGLLRDRQGVPTSKSKKNSCWRIGFEIWHTTGTPICPKRPTSPSVFD